MILAHGSSDAISRSIGILVWWLSRDDIDVKPVHSTQTKSAYSMCCARSLLFAPRACCAMYCVGHQTNGCDTHEDSRVWWFYVSRRLISLVDQPSTPLLLSSLRELMISSWIIGRKLLIPIMVGWRYTTATAPDRRPIQRVGLSSERCE